MKRAQYDKFIEIMGLFTIASLVINVPNMFGYSKMWQIVAFGISSVLFMILSFNEQVKEFRLK